MDVLVCLCRSDVVNENKANARYSMSARVAQDDPLSSPDVRVVPANQEHSFFYLSLEPDECARVSLLSLIRFGCHDSQTAKVLSADHFVFATRR